MEWNKNKFGYYYLIHKRNVNIMICEKMKIYLDAFITLCIVGWICVYVTMAFFFLFSFCQQFAIDIRNNMLYLLIKSIMTQNIKGREQFIIYLLVHL
jgi:hypothetical protein